MVTCKIVKALHQYGVWCAFAMAVRWQVSFSVISLHSSMQILWHPVLACDSHSAAQACMHSLHRGHGWRSCPCNYQRAAFDPSTFVVRKLGWCGTAARRMTCSNFWCPSLHWRGLAPTQSAQIVQNYFRNDMICCVNVFYMKFCVSKA